MKVFLLGLLFIFILCFGVAAETLEERIKKLEETIQLQQEMLKNQQKTLEELKEQARKEKPPTPPEAAPTAARDYRLDDRSKGIYVPAESPVTPYPVTKQTSPSLMNPAISMTLDTFYYGSSLSKSELNSRNIPGYIATETPFTQGFNLRSAELSIFAPVDPYFNFYATIPFTDSGGSLEEAYFVTTSLPAGFQLKGGKFRSGFGRINAFHPHAWDFVDIPLAYKAFIGDEGLIEKGAQLTYLPNFPFYTVLGMEVLQGDNPILYGSDAQSGFHAYTGFVKTSLDLGTTHTLLLGGSATGGKTLTDSAAPNTQFTGNSILYGVELTYKWKPSKKESFILQSEYLYRSQRGDLSAYTVPVTDSLKRLQDGIYVQGIYQWQRWRFGARYDHLGLFQDTVILGGEKINYDQNLYRMTGSLEFNPTEFSRIRLQYNYDRSDPNQKVNQELFLQLILAVGAHGAHPF